MLHGMVFENGVSVERAVVLVISVVGENETRLATQF
jgi:hypothetical protein